MAKLCVMFVPVPNLCMILYQSSKAVCPVCQNGITLCDLRPCSIFDWQNCVIFCPSIKAVRDVLSRLAKLCVMLCPSGRDVCDVLFRVAKLCVISRVAKLCVMFYPVAKLFMMS